LKISSRIAVRCSLCRAALSWSAGLDLTSWANCCGSTDENVAGSNSGMVPPIGRKSYSRVTLRTSRYARKVRRLPRSVREQQMLDAAVAVFSAAGYHAASMDEISGRAGISKPMVYAYLGTKEELF